MFPLESGTSRDAADTKPCCESTDNAVGKEN